MKNERIAQLVTELAFKPHSENSPEFAAQLFVERVVLPKDVDSYSKDEMEKYILNYLNNTK